MRPTVIWIGYENEQNARTIDLDISDLLEQYPAATPQLLVHKSEDYVNYIATTTVSGSTLSWTITAYDLTNQKNGTAQVVLVDSSGSDDVVLASEVIPVRVSDGITNVSSSDLPTPQETYLTQILAAADRAEAAAATFSITFDDSTGEVIVGGGS